MSLAGYTNLLTYIIYITHVIRNGMSAHLASVHFKLQVKKEAKGIKQIDRAKNPYVEEQAYISGE